MNAGKQVARNSDGFAPVSTTSGQFTRCIGVK
jgi:hypothetical protein